MADVSSPSPAPLRRRIARSASDPLLRSAYSLMANVALTSLLGFGFWIAAARMFSSATVGRDGALIAAMITLSTICQLNLTAGILRFLPIVKLDPQRTVLVAYVVTGCIAAIAGVAFVAIAPDVAHSYGFLRDDPPIAVAYVAATALWGVFALQDAVLTALRRAPWVPLENALFGILKLAALPVLLAIGSAHAIFVAWAVPMALLVVPVNWLIFAKVIPGRPERGNEPSPVERFGWAGLTRFLAQDYLAAILTQAATTMLPALVVAVVGSSESAYFYIPFTIVSAFDLLFVNVAGSLTVEGALAESRLPALVRVVVRRFGPVLVGGVVLLVAASGVVLAPFGAQYAHDGATVLRLLACASLFRATIALFAVICRIRGWAARILAMQGSVFAMVIALALVLGDARGIEGVASGWLIANAVAAFAAAPLVLRTLRAGRRVARGSTAAVDT